MVRHDYRRSKSQIGKLISDAIVLEKSIVTLLTFKMDGWRLPLCVPTASFTIISQSAQSTVAFCSTTRLTWPWCAAYIVEEFVQQLLHAACAHRRASKH